MILRFFDIVYSWLIMLFVTKRGATYVLLRHAEKHEDPTLIKFQLLQVLDELASTKKDRRLQKDCATLMIKAKKQELKKVSI